jgi:hypothetical protein
MLIPRKALLTTTLLGSAALMAACGEDDGAPGGQDAGPTCVSAATRAELMAPISGTVVDFASKAPVAGAKVEINTEFDGSEKCPPLATLTTDGQGKFGPMNLGIGSPLNPPIVAFRVSGGGRAITVSDQKAKCPNEVCEAIVHTIPAPAATLAATWRQALGAGGMPNAETRGLAVFEYREADASPAAGAVPTHFADDKNNDLVPGTEVRFLEADRATVSAVSQTATTASGLAIVGPSGNAGFAILAGRRAAQLWGNVTVLLDPGQIFVEDERVTVP